MSSRFQLGKKGERAAQHLLGVYGLSTVFEPCLVLSPHGRALAELRRRLAVTAGRLEHLEPDQDLADRIGVLMEQWSPDLPRPVVWLQQKSFEAEAWRSTLSLIQTQRELYRVQAPWMWVLAGPPDLRRLVNERAPHVLSGVTVRLLLDDPLTSSQGPFRWLHLSDFHFRARQRWDRRATLSALLRHVEKHEGRGLKPDFVFVTGDVAFSGQHEEYEEAQRFFAEMAEKLALDPRERFFFVPGNHDVDRGAISTGDRRILRSLATQVDVEEVFDDSDTMALLGRRLESFYAFTERLQGPARGWHAERPWRVDVRQAGGVDVAVLQLNSAWASGKDDSAGLLVGETQLRQALEESADAFLRIVLVHHPLADLKDFDRQRLETLYDAEDVHFVLRGHLHRNRTEAVRTPDGLVVELAAGAVYPGGDYEKTYLLTETDLEKARADVHFYRYNESGRGFWAEDSLTYEKARHGVWTLDLPESLRLEADAPPPAERELTASRRATLAERYRTAAAVVHGTVRFVGFADHRPRPNVQVPELFVPLRLEARSAEQAGEESWTTSRLLRSLLRHDAASRVVVLGDPGSGKTTLCRFAAVVIAREAECNGVEIREDVLPLFLPFRDYVRVCRESGDRSILEYLADQARTLLQVTVPDAFIEGALNGGRAVLLLDGLDEVGSASDREEMRERVQAFCRLYPRVPALVTSRIAGYDDAPLPRQGPDAFVHLALAPFDDDDLRRFVASWYAVQEAHDPVARGRGVADLTAALDADERVRELARNPMLATLVALVHRYEADLPGERAALYDICVKTLLETWPASRRKTFEDIDERLQRAYLETLAYRMQSSRSEDDWEVVIEREPLIDSLVEIVRRRSGASGAPETTRGPVERWVRFLEQGTGILVEQRPGVFAFFHLSLMEYLAARGMDEAEVLEEAVAERFCQPGWLQVCLLAVGSRATEPTFLERLYGKLGEQPGGWSFLLRCLREEAAFDDEQRAAIVRGAGRDLLEKWPAQWQEDRRALDDLTRFSIRHAEWAKAWIPREVVSARGEALRAVVALRFKNEGLLESLKKRRDVETAAADLLEYWPEPQIGRWAAATVTFHDAFEWSMESPGELLVLRALRSMTAEEKLAPGLLLRLLWWTSGMAALARSSARNLADCERPGGHGLPAAAQAEPGALEIEVLPFDLFSSSQEDGGYFARYFARGFVLDFARGFALDFSLDFARGFALDFSRYFARDFARDFARYFSRYFARDFAQYFARDFARYFARDFARDFARYFARDFEEAFSLEWIAESPNISCPKPDDDHIATDASALQQAGRADDREETRRQFSIVLTRLATDALIAGVTTAEASKEERLAYVHRRVQNSWLLQVWFAIDGQLPESPEPGQLALYLGLGLTQATTTWQWPATERWIALLGGEPPEHWLPRSQWHLCWRLHDSEDEAHRRGLAEALAEGLGDEERPGVAAELMKLVKLRAVAGSP